MPGAVGFQRFEGLHVGVDGGGGALKPDGAVAAEEGGGEVQREVVARRSLNEAVFGWGGRRGVMC